MPPNGLLLHFQRKTFSFIVYRQRAATAGFNPERNVPHLHPAHTNFIQRQRRAPRLRIGYICDVSCHVVPGGFGLTDLHGRCSEPGTSSFGSQGGAEVNTAITAVCDWLREIQVMTEVKHIHFTLNIPETFGHTDIFFLNEEGICAEVTL